MQTTNQLLMIRPVDFKFNTQTAENNKFQEASAESGIQEQALQEFDNFVTLLRTNGVEVTVVDDTLHPETPDSIFPNNWISFHEGGRLILYPMFSENRRLERRDDIVMKIREEYNVTIMNDLSVYEAEGIYLEGTGSMVLDRQHKIAYACLSIRTDKKVLDDFCDKSGYTPFTFEATDSSGFPIYHTNVMMCIGDRFAVVCFESIRNPEQQGNLETSLTSSGKEVIAITVDQMNHFAGNMLQVKNSAEETLLVMSEQAYLSLSPQQIDTLSKYSRLIYAPLYTIEKNGGGSARCMLAEIHLTKY
jgi:hypothetical protein